MRAPEQPAEASESRHIGIPRGSAGRASNKPDNRVCIVPSYLPFQAAERLAIGLLYCMSSIRSSLMPHERCIM